MRTAKRQEVKRAEVKAQFSGDELDKALDRS